MNEILILAQTPGPAAWLQFVPMLLILVVFYFLLRAGMDYRLNTLIGIAIAVVLNFFGYDRLVFRRSSDHVEGQ